MILKFKCKKVENKVDECNLKECNNRVVEDITDDIYNKCDNAEDYVKVQEA